MLKSTLLSLTILVSSTFCSAEPVVVPAEAFTTPEVASALATKCNPDCLVLDRADWTALLAKMQAAIAAAKGKSI